MTHNENQDAGRKRHDNPYGRHHKIPTIAGFREEKEARLERANAEGYPDDAEEPGRPATVEYFRNSTNDGNHGKHDQQQNGTNTEHKEQGDQQGEQQGREEMKDTSEAEDVSSNPKTRRKQMNKSEKRDRHGKDERAERVVTDPITHLPLKIYDLTSEALEQVPENDEPFGSTQRTATGISGKTKSADQLKTERKELQQKRNATEALFPPPDFMMIKQDLTEINSWGMTIGLAGAATIGALAWGVERVLQGKNMSWGPSILVYILIVGVAGGAIAVFVKGVTDSVAKRVDRAWDEEVWEANRNREKRAEETETVVWLNSLLGSVWPLINPDLFLGMADMLEDVMQASLPRLVRMVSVDDVGQGSENPRILGVKWLPSGAAARSVGDDGKLKQAGDDDEHDDESKKKPEEREVSDEDEEEYNEQMAMQGMEAEEGDFINLEVAFAYRVRSVSKTMKDRSRNMHVYMAFYLPGNVKLPVWVDLRGIIGTMRLRLQLCPDPPFFSLCTLTFLGQPKVDISCTPLTKHAPNLLDLPLISHFVQSSVDAAMAEYVAPKSLTLDLQDLLAGDDRKKDTDAVGVIVVHIKRGFDFKAGDSGIPIIKEESSDPYVSVGWAKFGKPLFSTRLLKNEMDPNWDETAYMLVTAEELNVQERVRVQLWDSDRFTADDDLGRIEVDVKKIMHSPKSHNTMWERSDGFRALKAGDDMPGKLEWRVGYFPKADIQADQIEKQTYDSEIRSYDQLKNKVEEISNRKLREAVIKKGRHRDDANELEQQKRQELDSYKSSMIMSAPPPKGYPSGVFGILVHNITGLELEKLSKDTKDKNTGPDEEEEEDGDNLPSAYCNIIVNHRKAFRTRTKPKNGKPFYNAGCERFLGDWQNAEVIVSVRDARIKEEDPLLGIVHLPLGQVFAEQSAVSGFYPLVGGVAYGRVRLSLCWRSITLQAPPRDLGWQLGTLQVKPGIIPIDLPNNLRNLRLKIHTDIGMGKMHAPHSDKGYHREAEEGWSPRKKRSLRLPVAQRYPTCVAIEFHQKNLVRDSAAAFAVLWLREIPDDQEQELTLDVWKGDFKRSIATVVNDPGEKMGQIRVKLCFWSGLGGAHEKWVKGDADMRNVYEVLECAKDNLEEIKQEEEAGIIGGDNSDDSSSSSESESESEADEGDAPKQETKRSDTAESNSGSKGPIERYKHYKRHEKGMHRRHRGVMQFRASRTAKWAFHKLDAGRNGVGDLFKHHTRQPGVETEA